jgi:hypothetical protein
MLTQDILRRLWPRAPASTVAAIARTAENVFASTGINTPLRQAHFLAQISHECGAGTIVRENMNYSARRLMEIFGVGRHSRRSRRIRRVRWQIILNDRGARVRPRQSEQGARTRQHAAGRRLEISRQRNAAIDRPRVASAHRADGRPRSGGTSRTAGRCRHVLPRRGAGICRAQLSAGRRC